MCGVVGVFVCEVLCGCVGVVVCFVGVTVVCVCMVGVWFVCGLLYVVCKRVTLCSLYVG